MGDRERAYTLALGLLARRDHGAAELARKLALKRLPVEVIEETVERLRRIGYLDDQRYARQWAESALRSGRAFGPRLRLELLRRGVAEETVAEVLAELVPIDSEDALVRTILARRFPAFDPRQSPEGERRRVFAYLQRRGFSARTILNVFHTPEPQS